MRQFPNSPEVPARIWPEDTHTLQNKSAFAHNVLARASLLFPFPTLPRSQGTRLAVGDVIALAAFLGTFASVLCGFFRETRNRCRATRLGRHRLAPPASSGKPLRADAVGGPATDCVIESPSQATALSLVSDPIPQPFH